jgi:hypothetical protein
MGQQPHPLERAYKRIGGRKDYNLKKNGFYFNKIKKMRYLYNFTIHFAYNLLLRWSKKQFGSSLWNSNFHVGGLVLCIILLISLFVDVPNRQWADRSSLCVESCKIIFGSLMKLVLVDLKNIFLKNHGKVSSTRSSILTHFLIDRQLFFFLERGT